MGSKMQAHWRQEMDGYSNSLAARVLLTGNSVCCAREVALLFQSQLLVIKDWCCGITRDCYAELCVKVVTLATLNLVEQDILRRILKGWCCQRLEVTHGCVLAQTSPGNRMRTAAGAIAATH
eukprot:4187123-Amphidinium_carterae.1